MICETLQLKSDRLWTAIYQSIHEDHETPSNGVLSNAWNVRDEASSCVASQPVITTVIDLNGKWAAGGVPGPTIHVQGNFITVDMSAYPGKFGEKTRPLASGIVLDPNHILVMFPDDTDYTGTIELPNTILWSNHSSWAKS
jgi:hypothetical protein